MKFKHFAPLVILAPLALLAACGGGTVPLTMHAYWYADDVNSNIVSDTETLTYEVTYKAPTSGSSLLKFEYETGTYTTTLQELSSLAQFGVSGKGYSYQTKLEISGSYTYGNQEAVTFSDSITSEVWFGDIGHELRPIRSFKQYNVHSVYGSAVTEYSYNYTAIYDEALKSTTVTIRGLEKEDVVKTLKLKGSNPFLDNEQILLALRTVDLANGFTFRTVNPVDLERTSVTMAATPTETAYVGTFTRNGTEVAVDNDLPVASFKIGYTAAKSGQPIAVTYALPSAKYDFRNVLVEMTTQAASGLGTFTYKLKELRLFAK